MTTINSVLYATDFSPPSAAAFPLAAALARDHKAKLMIAHVRPTPAVAFTPGSMALVEPANAADEVLQQLKQQFDLNDDRITVEYLVVEGDPATELLDLARKTKCDLIVMGTHGRTGFSRLLAGSVAEQMLRHAPCPVLTVRANKPEPPPDADAARSQQVEDVFTAAPYLP